MQTSFNRAIIATEGGIEARNRLASTGSSGARKNVEEALKLLKQEYPFCHYYSLVDMLMTF